MVIKTQAPNWHKIKKQWPEIDPKRIVVTHYPNIHYMGAGLLSPDVLHHEKIHLTQQGEMGVDEWWHMYLTEPQFRLEQEIEAYQAQYTYLSAHMKDRNALAKALYKLAGDLSGHMYGNLLSQAEATKLIVNKK